MSLQSDVLYLPIPRAEIPSGAEHTVTLTPQQDGDLFDIFLLYLPAEPWMLLTSWTIAGEPQLISPLPIASASSFAALYLLSVPIRLKAGAAIRLAFRNNGKETVTLSGRAEYIFLPEER